MAGRISLRTLQDALCLSSETKKTCKIASLVKQNSTIAKFRFELANREVSIFFLDLFREGCPKTQNCRISIRITYYACFTDYKPYGLI